MTQENSKTFELSASGQIKVRIPPSPTGFMHIGTARTALFNYLFARQNNGSVILRMEDTDKDRSKKEYADDIIEGLKWLGIDWDEGPFYQSQRIDIYRSYLQKLLDEDKAYYCFCSPEELEARRQYQMSMGEAPIYSGQCADLSKEDALKMVAQGKKFVIRFRTQSKKIKFNDLVRGEIEFDASLLGDFVIAKDLETALYNFTVAVDDFEMKITHVIRGEDILSNTPKQILIQEALGFPQPKYAHLPIILGSDRSKLSKRHGAAGLSEYKHQGYLPEALVNFIAFLGWNPGTEQEIFSMKALFSSFSLDKIQKGGAVFNLKRLDYLNSFYIRQKNLDDLTLMCVPFLVQAGLLEQKDPYSNEYIIAKTGEKVSFEFIKKVIFYHQQRIKKLSDVADLTAYLFSDTPVYSLELLAWKDQTPEQVALALDECIELFSKIEKGEWNKENLEKKALDAAPVFSHRISKPEWDRGYLLWPLRVSLSGQKMSASPFELADILGREKTLRRIQEAINLEKNA